jgi:hypothetical protein
MVPVETILKEALELPADLRAELVGQLMRSLPIESAPAPAAKRSNEDVPMAISWEGAQGFLED